MDSNNLAVAAKESVQLKEKDAKPKLKLPALDMNEDDLKRAKARHQELVNEWKREEGTLRRIRDTILIYRGLFVGEKPDKDGAQKDVNVYNAVGGRSARTLAAGLQSGVTSPARPWFKLIASNPDVGDLEPVKAYCDEVQRRMAAVFAKSNLYNSLHTLYLELAGFATGVMLISEDYDSTIRCRTFTAGEYALGINENLDVDKLARTVEMTARQIAGQFGEENLPEKIKSVLSDDKGNLKPFKVFHLIEPNSKHGPKNAQEEKMPTAYRSIYWIEGEKLPVQVKGYQECPFVAPRWDVVANQVYGRGPSWEALGDVRMLQRMEKDGLTALAKMVNPPILAPDGLRHINVMPGGVTRYSEVAGAAKSTVQPFYQVNPDLNSLLNYIRAKEDSVRSSFYADLFSMLSTYAGPQMTAQEVIERHEEKMIMLGPVLERLHTELLNPLVARTFNVMDRMGQLPEAPEEFQGMAIKVEYVSILAQAQKMVGMKGIQDFVLFTGSVAEMCPEVLDRVDFPEMLDRAAESLGVPTGIVFGEDEYAARLAQRQEAQQEAMLMEKAQQELAVVGQAAGAAKDLSQAQLADPSALSGLMGMNGG